MKQRDEPLAKVWVQIVHTLTVDTSGGMQKMNCVNTEGAFRIIQSIPSPKAEPFKRWLAKVGYERVQEIEDPELAQKRMKDIYKLKGYSDEWIEKRVRGVAIRDELTDEWDIRGAKSKQDYSILTADISRATFGLTPTEYKRLKGLKNENLDAKEGGDVAGATRKDIEGKLGKSVVSSDNYLETPEKTKRMEYKNKKKLIE